MICQACGIEAPTKRVVFYQNIGLLVLRFSQTAEGQMCKSCVHSTFWQYTLTTLVLGWWGIISLIVTPIFLLNNIFCYIFCLGMESVPIDASVPELNDDAIERLQPLTNEIVDLLNQGDDYERVVENIAMKAHVTKGQVALYIHALVAAAQKAE